MLSLSIDILIASLLLAATSLSSRMLVWMPRANRARWLPWLQPLAVGLLVGDSLLHVLPHALASHMNTHDVLLAFVVGATFLVLVETAVRSRMTKAGSVAPAARMTLVSDFIHHGVDGIILAGAFFAGNTAGYAALAAIAVHEVPREVASAGVLVSNGYTPKRAFLLSLGMASAVPLGAFAVVALLPSAHVAALVASFAGGTILYVALADILPASWLTARGHTRWAPAAGVMIGVLSMWLMALGEHG